jgi:hypothetical protein
MPSWIELAGKAIQASELQMAKVALGTRQAIANR